MAEYNENESFDDYERYREEATPLSDDSEHESEAEEEQDPINSIRMNVFRVAEPFSLDPLAIAPEEHGEGQAGDDDEMNDPNYRLNLEDWCTCHKCIVLETPKDRVCCKEIGKVDDILEWEKERDSLEQVKPCITAHRSYYSLIENVDALEMAWGHYKSEYPDGYEGPYDRRMRHVSYRQFQRWVHGRLGRTVRVVIPACTVKKIRDAYPAPLGDYTGFSYD